MCFDKNINENRDVKFLECDYLLVQRCVKLTLAEPLNKSALYAKYLESNLRPKRQ